MKTGIKTKGISGRTAKTGANLTPEEVERRKARYRKKTDRQKARRERKKAGELKEKVS